MRSLNRGALDATAVLTVAVLGGTTLGAVPAWADEDARIAEAGELSRQASATNEQVLEIERQIGETSDHIADTQRQIDESVGKINDSQAAIDAASEAFASAQAEAANASEYAQQARDAQDAVQQHVDQLAGANYRGIVIDPLTNAIHSIDPQAMIDRVAYMGVLSREATAELETLQKVNREAADKASRANAAVAEANWAKAEVEHNHRVLEQAHEDLEAEKEELTGHLESLKQQHAELSSRQAALSEQAQSIRSMIDSFSAEQQQAWVNQYGANTVDPLGLQRAQASAQGVVSSAMSRIGSPYEWGATGPNSFDCSGLMVWSYAQNGKSIPRTSQAQIAGGTPVSKANLQPGDIVGFYSGITHVGMYIGNGQIVHASDYGIPVQVASLDSMPFAGAARY